nr:MAG TPA: hypothetical protein [Caudoviricetes sp.]
MSDIKEHLVAALLCTRRGRGSILNWVEGLLHYPYYKIVLWAY